MSVLTQLLRGTRGQSLRTGPACMGPHIFSGYQRSISGGTSSSTHETTLTGPLASHVEAAGSDGPRDVSVGDFAELRRVFSDRDIRTFADCSGDRNPVHLDEDFAATTRFGGRIAHGMLCGSTFSTIFATCLPGCIYANQSLRFVAPVYIDDYVTARVEVTRVLKKGKQRFVTCTTQCHKKVEDDKDVKVIDGEATVVLFD